MSEENTAAGSKPKSSRRKKIFIGLIIFLLLLILGAIKIKIIKMPECHPAIQEEVDWPPEEPGVYERASSNKLRALDAAPRLPFTPAGRLELCNVPGADAAETVASVPADAEIVVIQANAAELEYHLYNSVDLPDTGECARVEAANEVTDIEVKQDDDNDEMMWISPNGLEADTIYMLTVGVAPPAECNTGADQECWGVILRVASE